MERITQLRIRNVRAIVSLDLDLARPATVLIGENGAGKSTILECLEILRKAATEPNFVEVFYAAHRGLPGLLRSGAPEMEIGVTVEDADGAGPRLHYDLIVRSGADVASVSEFLHEGDGHVPADRPNLRADLSKLQDLQKRRRVQDSAHVRKTRAARIGALEAEIKRSESAFVLHFARTPAGLEYTDPATGVSMEAGSVAANRLLLTDFDRFDPHSKPVARMLAALRGVEVHVPIDTTAAWSARSNQLPQTVRGSSTLFPADRLKLLGTNLASAWAALRNRASAHWNDTLDLVRLGLGRRVDTVVINVDPGGGNVALSLKFVDLADAVPAGNLSDGQLSWLAFVAMARLNPARSLLAIDEPELHIHPSLLARVVDLLTHLDGGAPVLLSTHSDRVLDLIDDPVAAVRVCRLKGSEVVVERLDAIQLRSWLEDYSGLGQLRASGYLDRALVVADGGEP